MNKIIDLSIDTPKNKAATILKLFFYYFVGGVLSCGFMFLPGGLAYVPGLIFGIFFLIMIRQTTKELYRNSIYAFIIVSTIAYFIAIYLFFNYNDLYSKVPYSNYFASGFLGAALLSVGFYFVKKISNFFKIFFTTIFFGGIGGLVFFTCFDWINQYDFRLSLAFGMWQGVVGTTLTLGYLIGEKDKLDDNDEPA